MGSEALSKDSGGAHRKTAIALFAFAALILAAGVTPHWRMTPDSALYAGIARSLATGRGYTFSGDPQVSIPPAVPLYLALAYKCGQALEPGISPRRVFLYLNAFSALVGFAGLAAAYFLVREMAGARRAALVLLFLATSVRYFSLSIVPLTDVPYCAVSWGVLVCFVRIRRGGGWGWRLAAAGLLVIAVLTRLVAVVLLACVVGYYAAVAVRKRGERRNALVGVLTGVPGVVASAVFIFVIWCTRGNGIFNYWDDLVTGWGAQEVAGRFLANLAALPDEVFTAVVSLESLAGVKFILLALVLWGAAVSWKKGPKLPVGYSIAGALYICLGYKLLGRYITPFLPFVYLFMIEGAVRLADLICRRFAEARAAAALGHAAVALITVLVSANCVYVGREIVYNFSDDFYALYRHGKYEDFILLTEYLTEKPPAGRILAAESRVLSTMSGLDTAPPPFHPEVIYRPSTDEIGEYVSGRRVTAIVVDPRQAESAEIFQGFIDNGPYSWRKEEQFGRLAYYVPGGQSPAPAAQKPPRAP